MTGTDKTIDIVVDIFNRVNSGGTKLSKGDLALAKICADWPEARDTMKATLKEWADAGYGFTLDWLLRSVNTVLTGEAKFQYLHDKDANDIQDSLKRAVKHINNCLNMIAGRLGLDHDRVFFGRFAVPVIVRYLDRNDGMLNEQERDKLLLIRKLRYRSGSKDNVIREQLLRYPRVFIGQKNFNKDTNPASYKNLLLQVYHKKVIS